MRKNKSIATYDHATKKIFIMPWQEARGILYRVKRIAEAAVLTLAFNAEYVEIEIPLIELQASIDDLGELIGKLVSILRTEARFYLISAKRHGNVKNERTLMRESAVQHDYGESMLGAREEGQE